MSLQNKKVAILTDEGFEESELFEPLHRLQQEGAEVHIVSTKSGEIQGMKEHQWSKKIKVDQVIDAVKASDYDALVLPGGVINPDILRNSEKSVQFVKDFADNKKPIAAICHGPQTLINAGAVEGKKLTSFPSIKVDLQNAGAHWVDEEVVVDNGLVTSRTPKDLPAFLDKMVEEIAEGKH
ncbi:General stress protein 18 [Candidatus Ornithobacterium hominis]|uniref:type 1 glutamine amidotransferase domain-containing protein n=1 Tax=Candidatus Ornithobacterium hominis TaxID=2497989 RepID=UPI0024BCFE7D|nr:type 1 glutamine amidotransferase domain-containing protein [Candidatus Ornithobacterium hominis]CAI9428746.1 General stress protein 18 [Candidatus Ornithobacterium hominis]